MQSLGNFPILASFFAGLLTFISPCILPLIPVYITLVTGLSVEQLNEKKHIVAILLSSISFVLGFTTVFVILGLSVTFLGQFFLNHLDVIRYIGGAIIIFFSLQTLLKGATLLLVYSLGLAIPFILTALFINKFIFVFNALKKHYKLIEQISAILLILVGTLVITGGFSQITIFVTKIFR